MFGLFKTSKRNALDTAQVQFRKRKADNKPSDFKINEVYEMSSGYHTSKPYYVLIDDIEDDFIETTIPHKHSLKIMYNSFEWKYHIPRMTYIGVISNPEIKKLLHQPHLLTHNK